MTSMELIMWASRQRTGMQTANLLIYVLVMMCVDNSPFDDDVDTTILVSRKDMADACEYHRRTVDRALQHLERIGLIDKHPVHADGRWQGLQISVMMHPVKKDSPRA